MLVGAEPERLHGGHPKLAGTPDVLVEAVADENAVGGRDSERVERALEDRRMRLALAHLGREAGEIETLGEPHLPEIAVEKPAGIERVRDQPELEASRPQGLPQRRRVRRSPPPRIPGP